MQNIYMIRRGIVIGILTIFLSNPTQAQDEPSSITAGQRQVYIDENGDGFNDNTPTSDSKRIFNVYSREGNRKGYQLGRTESGIRFRYLTEKHFRLNGKTQNNGSNRGKSFENER